MKLQGKPFPEQVTATLIDNRDTQREYSNGFNGHRLSKLPITSRLENL